MEAHDPESIEEQIAVIDLDRAELLFVLQDVQEAVPPVRRNALDTDDPRPSAQR